MTMTMTMTMTITRTKTHLCSSLHFPFWVAAVREDLLARFHLCMPCTEGCPCLQTVAGTGHCWGYAPHGDECSGVDFTGVTDVFSTANAFLALNRDTATTTATTTTTAIATTTKRPQPPPNRHRDDHP